MQFTSTPLITMDRRGRVEDASLSAGEENPRCAYRLANSVARVHFYKTRHAITTRPLNSPRATLSLHYPSPVRSQRAGKFSTAVRTCDR